MRLAFVLAVSLLSLAPLVVAGAPAHAVDVNARGFTDSATGTPVTVVAPGTTIAWTVSSGRHTVTALDGSFTSDTMEVGESYSRTFEAAGVVPYRCAIHATMIAVVVVSS